MRSAGRLAQPVTARELEGTGAERTIPDLGSACPPSRCAWPRRPRAGGRLRGMGSHAQAGAGKVSCSDDQVISNSRESLDAVGEKGLAAQGWRSCPPPTPLRTRLSTCCQIAYFTRRSDPPSRHRLVTGQSPPAAAIDGVAALAGLRHDEAVAQIRKPSAGAGRAARRR
jgi:hypothetical protein